MTARKKKGKKKPVNKYTPWTCDECKAGGNCVRPEHCEVSLERKRAYADFLLDQAKEDRIFPRSPAKS